MTARDPSDFAPGAIGMVVTASPVVCGLLLLDRIGDVIRLQHRLTEILSEFLFS